MQQVSSAIFIVMPIVCVLALLFLAGLPLVVNARDERQLRRDRAAAARNAAIGAGPAAVATALTEQRAAGSPAPEPMDRDR